MLIISIQHQTKMPSYMHTTLEKIDKHNKYRNKIKMRRLEKVSDELLAVVEYKNNIIDEQAAEIQKLHAIIDEQNKVYTSQRSLKSKTKFEFMDNSTIMYCFIGIVLMVLKSFI